MISPVTAELLPDGVEISFGGVTAVLSPHTVRNRTNHQLWQMMKLLRIYSAHFADVHGLPVPLEGRFVETETEFVFEGETEFTVPRRIVIPGEAIGKKSSC